VNKSKVSKPRMRPNKRDAKIYKARACKNVMGLTLKTQGIT